MEIKIRTNTSGALLTGKGPAIVQKNLDAAITEATNFLDAQVKARTPQGVSGAQGGLIASIQHDVYSKGTPVVKGVVMTGHLYAEVIEKGRKPGKGIASAVSGGKYVSPLIPWVQTKLGISGEEAKQVAFLIGRKIKKKGFAGAHMFTKAADDNWPAIQKIFERRGITITRELSE